MDFRIQSLLKPLLIPVLLLTGCMAGYNQPYNSHWSKAKNLSQAAGMEERIYDQQLPDNAYSQEGKLLDYQLGSITHLAYGSFSGLAGIHINPYGPYEDFYWGWTIPGISHQKEHRLFAWMPLHMAEDIVSARTTFETMLSHAATAILDEMNYRYHAVEAPFVHDGRRFRQWYLEDQEGHCSVAAMDCVLSLYIPQPEGPYRAPKFSYHNIAGEASWYFSAENSSTFPRLILAEGDGTESISESVFYQKLSARLPGWVYFYMAPNEAGTGEDNKTVPYPYVLEKGRPLLFIRPVSGSGNFAGTSDVATNEEER